MLDTLDVDGALDTTETSLLETKKVEVGNPLDAGGTLDIAGELRLNKSLDKVVSVKAQNTYLVDSPTLDSNIFPYIKPIDSSVTKMQWRSITYKSGTTDVTNNFLVLGIAPIEPETAWKCRLTSITNCGGTAYTSCPSTVRSKDYKGNTTANRAKNEFPEVAVGSVVKDSLFKPAVTYYDLFQNGNFYYNTIVCEQDPAESCDVKYLMASVSSDRGKMKLYVNSKAYTTTVKLCKNDSLRFDYNPNLIAYTAQYPRWDGSGTYSCVYPYILSKVTYGNKSSTSSYLTVNEDMATAVGGWGSSVVFKTTSERHSCCYDPETPNAPMEC